MTTECAVCLEPLDSTDDTDLTPMVLNCGHTFHLKCVKKCETCPLCRDKIQTRAKNFALIESLRIRPQYELIVIDVSASMWYSDGFLPLIGTSRSKMAVKIVSKLLAERRKQQETYVGIAKFDSGLQVVQNFSTNPKLINVEQFAPNGKETALYDAIYHAQSELEKYPDTIRRVIILTDGGETGASKSENVKALRDKIKQKKKKLHTGFLYWHIGNNVKGSKETADGLDVDDFQEIREDNMDSVVKHHIICHPTTSKLLEMIAPKVPTMEVSSSQAKKNKERVSINA